MPTEESRRDFLKHTATAAGAGIVAAGLPQRVKAQAFSANERIGVGIIGLGVMGSNHLHVLMQLKARVAVDVVAVCDVFAKHLEEAVTKSGAKPYKVWTDLLVDRRVDAVLIATPDHWHAPMTLASLEAGKDVYCEKPMTHYDHLDLAKKVVETVAAKQRIMQLGTQKLSDDCWRLASENVAPLGKVLHAEGSDCRNWVFEPLEGDLGVVPGKTFDWDMWLGCDVTRVPKRPFDLRRCACFRDFWDYSGGPMTDQFPHVLTPWVRTLDLGLPKRVVTTGGLYYHKDGRREVPDMVQMCIDYEGGPSVSLLGSLATGQNGPMMVRGQKAALVVREPIEVQVVPEKTAGAGEPVVLKGKVGAEPNLHQHWRDFLNCTRTRKKPISNEVIAYRVMTALGMGVRSYRSGKAMGFDAETGTIREL